jgi:hypothetical protein
VVVELLKSNSSNFKEGLLHFLSISLLFTIESIPQDTALEKRRMQDT